MNNIELGRKIKEARLARKMTQNEVVGSFITRNMLSQIESGAASPSVKTLQYLSGVLDVPLSSLLPDENPTAANDSAEASRAFCELKRIYKNGDFAQAAKQAESIFRVDSPFYDEAVLLCSMAYLNIAKRHEADGNVFSALEYAEKAEKLAGNGIYPGRDIKTASLMMIDRLSDGIINSPV